MTAEAVLAVDLGTTRVKAAAVALGGEVVAQGERAYGVLDDGEPGRAEQNADLWWRATAEAVGEVAERARGAARIVAASVGGQGPSVAAVDASGAAVAPAVIWMDQRAEKQRRALAELAGQEVSPYSAVPRVMLLRDRYGEAYARARWVLQAWDLIAFRMTGVAVASTFRGASVFPPDLVAAAGLDPARFPRPIVMGEVGGTLRPEVAAALGLDAGIPVAGGVNDATATILGTGIVRKGLAIDYGGTSGGMGLAWDAPVAAAGISSWPAPAPGLFICGGALAAAGLSFAWLRETFAYARAEDALADAAAVAPGADGLVFLPYLAGERAPLWDERASGVLYGLRARHGRAHVARAVLEGVAYALRHIADVLRGAGADLGELRVSGGQSKSALWCRIKSDVLGVPVSVPAVTEGALLGEAMLAAVGSGRASDPVAAADVFVRVRERIEPDGATAGVHAERYATYRALYPRLRDLTG